jgi:uncharacterized membrane protein YsdA (DUF1294 family)
MGNIYLGLFLDIKFIIWGVFFIINFLAFLSVFQDKRKAIKNIKRTSEISFFLWGVFGGSLGVLLGMYFFHHKTKKLYFLLGFSVLFIQNILSVLQLIEFLT